MVMHTRKVTRLDDGYRDLVQPELSKDKSLANSHSSKYNDRKVSKFDSFDHRRRSNSPRSFHSRSSHYDDKSRDRRNHEENESTTKESKNRDQKHKDHKYEVHRLAERVCGDWSEHISRSGKRYFYNCRTEVSQWEKPDCWTEENSTQVASGKSNEKLQHDNSDRSKSSSSSKTNSNFGESRHSTNNKMSSSKLSVSSRRDGRDGRPSSRDERSLPKSTLDAKDNNSNISKDRTLREDRKRTYPQHSSSRSPTHSQKSAKYCSGGSSSDAGSAGCYRDGSGKNDSSGGASIGNSKRSESRLVENVDTASAKLVDTSDNNEGGKNSPVHEDMDISPDNSFSQNEIETRSSHDGLISKSPVPPSSSLLHPSGNNNNNSNYDNKEGTQSSHQPSSTTVSNSVSHPSSSQDYSGTSFTNTFASTSATTSHSSTNRNSGSSVVNSLQHQQSLQMTLAGLQQAVHRLTPDKVSASVSGQQSQSSSQANFANCVALLPVLLAQLSSQQQTGSGNGNSDNQLIIQQAIPLLKKLQEIVVHQQQQQQQRKLQQFLLQLLKMQQPDSANAQLSANIKGPGDDKAESPYSPPDSDGSPVDTPSHNRHYPHHHNRQPQTGNKVSPRHQQQQHHHYDSSHQTSSSRSKQDKVPAHQTSEETDDRLARSGANAHVGAHSRSEKNDTRPPINTQASLSTGSLTPNQHPPVPYYRRVEIELTPSLINHFNSRLIEHVINWPADSLVKQAECIAADKYSYLDPLCSQVSVELKQARSMVRAQEILSTRHEQRRIFIQHQLYELDRGLAMPSILSSGQTNPYLVAFGQQQLQQQQPSQHPHPTQHNAHHPPLASAPHQPATPSVAQLVSHPSPQVTQSSSQPPLQSSSPAQEGTPTTLTAATVVSDASTYLT